MTSSSPWNWKKIMKLSEFMKKRIEVVIKDGESTMLWNDNWHPLGILVKKFGSKVASDVGFDINYKVKKVIKGNSWYWPIDISHHLLEVKDLINFQPLGEMNKLVWM